MENWNRLAKPPIWALKIIGAGRLKGKSAINPQWRYQAMTEVYGCCGIGWKFEIVRLWLEQGPSHQELGSQVFAFAEIKLYIKDHGVWSDAIPGVGGHMLIPKEHDKINNKDYLYANDEAYKMAITDALSTAMKMLGVAADIYAGAWDGSKYINREEPQGVASEFITAEQAATINEKVKATGSDSEKFLKYMNAETVDTILKKDYQKAITALNAKKEAANAPVQP